MADMIDFKHDYANGKFEHFNYRFHACQAHMELSTRSWSDKQLARLYSYNTTMAGITAKGNVYLRSDFDSYSRTTTRQVTRFLSDLTGMCISVHDLRKWRKECEGGSTKTHYGIAFCDIDFIYENF